MDTSEGIRRIAIAIRWIGDALGALAALILGFGLVAKGGPAGGITGVTVALVIGGLIVATGRLLSWIIMGFAGQR